jgi:RNA polymerase sigma factor (TIGR02999 family)
MSSDRSATSRQVTTLLLAWAEGNDGALERLVPVVHAELRRLARRAMSGERQDHTLQPTALVNELYLRLIDLPHIQWTDRAHFFALAARLMRRMLVDLARSNAMQKRGGGARKVQLDESLLLAAAVDTPDIVSLNEALEALTVLDARRGQVVELRFFGGLDIDEVAAVLGVSRRTVLRDWTLARTWLFRELKRRGGATD